MLVLTRKLGEVVYIGDDITVRVLEIDRGRVRLGIDASRDVIILREEVYVYVKNQKNKGSEEVK